MANDLIRIRRDIYTNWSAANPVLALGEISYDLTNDEIRVGDGTSAWLSLPAVGSANLSDGDKGDIVVSSGGTVWSLSSALVAEIAAKLEASDLNLGTSTTPATTPLQIRRGNTLSWTGVVLQPGEIGFDSQLNEIRIGDGITDWDNLDPVGLNKLQNFSLEQIGDVEIADLTPGDVLIHDGTNWINLPIQFPATDLDDLTSVTLAAPTLGQVLTFNGTVWVNSTLPVLSVGVKNDINVVSATDWQIVDDSVTQAKLNLDLPVNPWDAATKDYTDTTVGLGVMSIEDQFGQPNGPAMLDSTRKIATASLATGTASSSTFLRGDRVWTTVPTGATNLDGLSDVTVTSPATSQTLKYNGTSWINNRLNLADISDLDSPVDGTVLGVSGGVWTPLTLTDVALIETLSPSGITPSATAGRFLLTSNLNNIGEASVEVVHGTFIDTATVDATFEDRSIGSPTAVAKWKFDVKDSSIGTAKLGGDITTAGKALLDDADAAAQRTTLGLGTAATSNTTAFAAASHTHAGEDITTGTVAAARLGSGTADNTTFLRGDNTWQTVSGGATNLDGLSDVTITTPATGQTLKYNGTVWANSALAIADVTSLQTALDGKAATSHTHAGEDITSGTIAAARLGSGTTNVGTYLRGDNTWYPFNIDALTDVSVGVVTDKQPLAFDGGTLQWTNRTVIRLDALELNTTPVAQSAFTGKIYWDATSNDLVTPLSGSVLSEIGITNHTRVFNNTGDDILRGRVVRVTGSQGQKITVALANASSETTAATTIGIAAEILGDGGEAFIITNGLLRGLNTNLLIKGTTPADGDALWLNTVDGEITVDRPTAPNHGVFLGWLIRLGSGTSGEIFVKVINGSELQELHDVLITTPITGHVLRYNGTVWANSALTTADVTGLDTALAGKASTSHTHGNITNVGAIGSTANLPLITTTSGVITTGSFGSTANTFCQGNDSRLSDARTPLAHTHAAADVTSGVFNTARLGTGTADNTTFLRGDGTWQTVSGGSSNLDGLTDVVITSVATNNLLRYNGTSWINDTVANSIPDLSLGVGKLSQGTATNGQVLAWNNIAGSWAPADPSGGSTTTSTARGWFLT